MINLLKQIKTAKSKNIITLPVIESEYSEVFVVKSETDIVKNLELFIPVNTTESIDIDIRLILKQQDKIKLAVYFLPQKDNFHIQCNISCVLSDFAKLELVTDTLVDDDIKANVEIPSKLKLGLVTDGYVNVQEKILTFDNATVKSIPEFSILPAGIEQIHGMVIYSLEESQKYFLNSRGIIDIKSLFYNI